MGSVCSQTNSVCSQNMEEKMCTYVSEDTYFPCALLWEKMMDAKRKFCEEQGHLKEQLAMQ